MTYEYWLPNENGQKVDYNSDQNAVIIIGANGSGKSKLGAWIEQQKPDLVHRIGGQRKLNFSEHLPLKSYKDAENYVFYGVPETDAINKFNYRWSNHPTTNPIDDFEDVLSGICSNLKQEKPLHLTMQGLQKYLVFVLWWTWVVSVAVWVLNTPVFTVWN